MSASSNSAGGRDTVQLRAVFVPEGETVPPEVLAGMTDVVRLSVRLFPGGDILPTPSDGTGPISDQQ